MPRPFAAVVPVAMAVSLVSAASAQQAVIFVDPIDTVYEDTTSASWAISARQIENEYPIVDVELDGVDVTSAVSATWSNETRIDVNQDGYLESFRISCTFSG